MRNRKHFPCTFEKACHVKYLVGVLGYSLTEAAIRQELNVGTVSHIIHGRRFRDAKAMPPSDE